jgi:oligopeptide/dipeptide ABC transporter ATP-binding protein
LTKEKLVEIKNLKVCFNTSKGVLKAVDGVDFEIYAGENLAIVGESGCGKSVTSLSIMRLIQDPPGKIIDGEIKFKGTDLLKIKSDRMRKIRGKDISMIFQEPMTSLNPVFTVGHQISEAILLHKNISHKQAMLEAVEMLRKVNIPFPEKRINDYPHQMSGGMRQRIMIAMALSCTPQLLIADEPTTALDVTIQAQILDLLSNLQEQYNMSMLVITHDLGVIAEIANRVAIMYAGEIVEYTDIKTLFSHYLHPYTYGLLNCVPKIDYDVERLITIPGNVPNPYNLTKGCKYYSRCLLADQLCATKKPDLVEIELGHKVRCWYYDKVETLEKIFTFQLNCANSELR